MNRLRRRKKSLTVCAPKTESKANDQHTFTKISTSTTSSPAAGPTPEVEDDFTKFYMQYRRLPRRELRRNHNRIDEILNEEFASDISRGSSSGRTTATPPRSGSSLGSVSGAASASLAGRGRRHPSLLRRAKKWLGNTGLGGWSTSSSTTSSRIMTSRIPASFLTSSAAANAGGGTRDTSFEDEEYVNNHHQPPSVSSPDGQQNLNVTTSPLGGLTGMLTNKLALNNNVDAGDASSVVSSSRMSDSGRIRRNAFTSTSRSRMTAGNNNGSTMITTSSANRFINFHNGDVLSRDSGHSTEASGSPATNGRYVYSSNHYMSYSVNKGGGDVNRGSININFQRDPPQPLNDVQSGETKKPLNSQSFPPHNRQQKSRRHHASNLFSGFDDDDDEDESYEVNDGFEEADLEDSETEFPPRPKLSSFSGQRSSNSGGSFRKIFVRKRKFELIPNPFSGSPAKKKTNKNQNDFVSNSKMCDKRKPAGLWKKAGLALLKAGKIASWTLTFFFLVALVMFATKEYHCELSRNEDLNTSELASLWQRKIVGQTLAKEAILETLNLHRSSSSPGVTSLVMSGWVGGGKTYAASVVKTSVYGRLSENVKEVSMPYLRGALPRKRIREYLVNLAAEMGRSCGHGLVIFDDAEPAKDEDDLIDFIRELRKRLSLGDSRSNGTLVLITTNAGGTDINRIVLENLNPENPEKSRESVTSEMIETEFGENPPFRKLFEIPDYVSKYAYFLPITRNILKSCIKKELKEKDPDYQTTSQEIEAIVSEFRFYSDDFPVFAVSGCKQVATKVDLALAARDPYLEDIKQVKEDL